MNHLGEIEDTLFIPMLGRIYASEYCKNILYDQKALALKGKLPIKMSDETSWNQYTLLAGAVRSANTDRYIQDFLKRKQNGIIVQLGCGLETAYYRNGNIRNPWYAVDLPDVIMYRNQLLPEQKGETYIAGDAFSDQWIIHIRNENPDVPVLVTACGLFYYFPEEKILGLLRMLEQYADIEVIFDTVSKRGLHMMQKKYLKQMGHEDVRMHFYVDSAEEMVRKIGGSVEVIKEEAFYRGISRKGLKLSTKISMGISDCFLMVKMIHLRTGSKTEHS